MQMKPSVPSDKEVIPKAAQKELTDLLGEKNVCFNRDMLSVFRCGPGAPFPGSKNPHGMVQPETTEEIQGIMKIANEHKFPVIVVSTSGPGVCLSGGLIIDTYTRMRKIHQIDPESGYVLVEPGVTNGQLLRALRPLGYWISFGSYPPYVGEIASLVCFNGYTNIIGKEHHFCIGLEVVLPTGEIIRTGTAALGYDWWTQYRGVPDLTSMWTPSFGTHGIITKAALRIHPLGEKRQIVIAGFNDFKKALTLLNNLSKEAMANTSMIWSHRWTEWENYMYQNGKGFMDYVNHMLSLGSDKAPPGYYPHNVLASFSGYKEQVEGGVKTCERLIKELGGEINTENFKNQWPGTWEWWKQHFLDLTNPGEGSVKSQVDGVEGTVGGLIAETNVGQAKEFHHTMMEKFHEFGIRSVRYYIRQYDHGRTTFLRYLYQTEQEDPEAIIAGLKTMKQIDNWWDSKEFKEKFPDVFRHAPPTAPIEASTKTESSGGPPLLDMPPGPPPGEGPPTGEKTKKSPYSIVELRKKILDIIDPNNLMDPATKKMEYDVWGKAHRETK